MAGTIADLDLSHGWNTGSWGLWRRVGEETVLQDIETLHDEGEKEDKDSKVKESNGSLCLSTSVLGTLGKLVVGNVALVGTSVASDCNGQSGCTCKSEDKVHEVENCQEKWRCQE